MTAEEHMDTQKTALQAQMLANRLKKRFRHLGKWARRVGTSAFRLYDRDIPEIPLVLDVYGDNVQGSAVSGALYKRPYEKSDEDEAAWLGAMQEAVAQALEIDSGAVIIKMRQKQRGLGQYEKLGARGLERHAREGALKFKVNLSDYLDTGLFLDRRAMRALVGAEARGGRALNLFCYTASFSLCAASGGALSTDSVDLSNTYLAWALENFRLNGFASEIFQRRDFFAARHGALPPNCLIRADARAFLRDAAEAGLRWDSIVVDPPAFSNSAMSAADFDLGRDYGDLLRASLALLAPGGKLWFSASARSFRGGADDLRAELSGLFPTARIADIGRQVVDEDFRDRKVPKAFTITL